MHYLEGFLRFFDVHRGPSSDHFLITDLGLILSALTYIFALLGLHGRRSSISEFANAFIGCNQTWPSQLQGRNVVASKQNREGVFVLSSSRNFRDEAGSNFWVQFKIVDQHRPMAGSAGSYNVTVCPWLSMEGRAYRFRCCSLRYFHPCGKTELPYVLKNLLTFSSCIPSCVFIVNNLIWAKLPLLLADSTSAQSGAHVFHSANGKLKY